MVSPLTDELRVSGAVDGRPPTRPGDRLVDASAMADGCINLLWGVTSA